MTIDRRIRIIRLPSIPELVDEIIDLAIERGRLEERLQNTLTQESQS